MSQVIIGMDPHKRSATIEVMTADEGVAGGGRYGTDAAGLAAMLAGVRQWPDRIWAVEGSRGVGRHVAAWLAGAGEQVVDVPPKLSARVRVFTSGQGRKTDAADAHAIALAATRMKGLRPVTGDARLEVLRVLADRRRPWAKITPGWSASCTSCWPTWFPAGRRSPCPRPRPGRS
jgi:transposase